MPKASGVAASRATSLGGALFWGCAGHFIGQHGCGGVAVPFARGIDKPCPAALVKVQLFILSQALPSRLANDSRIPLTIFQRSLTHRGQPRTTCQLAGWTGIIRL